MKAESGEARGSPMLNIQIPKDISGKVFQVILGCIWFKF